MASPLITRDAPLEPSTLIKSTKSSVLHFNPVFQKKKKRVEDGAFYLIVSNKLLRIY